MVYPTEILAFNPRAAMVMHVDINSCFASVEQQANPLLRGKPVAVAAYTTPSGCILAASVEAKLKGVKTGMRVKEGRRLIPGLVVLPADPDKYRQVHLGLKRVLADYSDRLVPKSIDEFVLNLEGCPALKRGVVETGREIKERIKVEVGEWIRVSIGLGPNRFLAKTASNLKKPDGLEVITKENAQEVYERLELEDLCGINKALKLRLNVAGIFSVSQFYRAEIPQLRAAFRSVAAYDWYWRLRGWEIDEVEFLRSSFGQSYALPKPFYREEDLAPIMIKLVEKMGARMRRGGYEAWGVHVGILYRDGDFWHQGRKLTEGVWENGEIYRRVVRLWRGCPERKPVSKVMVSCFNLAKRTRSQLTLFGDVLEKERLAGAVDRINETWGEFTVASARMAREKEIVADRISFGGVKELRDTI